MKPLFPTFLLLFLLSLLLYNAPAIAHEDHKHSRTEKAILKSFSKYRKALSRQNGKKAVKFVSEKTIAYYAQMLTHARSSDSSEVANLPVLDKLMVLSFRNRVSRAKLLSMSAKEAVIYAVDKGMIGKEGLSALELGDISVKKKQAKAQVLLNHQPAPLEFVFYKEKHCWKIDLTAFFPMAEVAVLQTAKELEMSQNELVEFLLKMVEPFKLNPKLWQPVLNW